MNKQNIEIDDLNEPEKPVLRGKIHAFAFFFCIFSSIAFFMTSMLKKFDKGVLIYLIVQLIQFGISASYHILDFNKKSKNFMRKLDHIAIFILISGTQTAVLLNSKKVVPTSVTTVIKWSWTISILGISKIIILNKIHNIFDLACYIAHGLLVVPFYNVVSKLSKLDISLAIAGGVFYITGGVIFGMESPNPIPKIFGFHEVFHVCTVIANLFFGIIILKPYIVSLIIE